MVEWLAGNRIRGTNSERINGTSGISLDGSPQTNTGTTATSLSVSINVGDNNNKALIVCVTQQSGSTTSVKVGSNSFTNVDIQNGGNDGNGTQRTEIWYLLDDDITNNASNQIDWVGSAGSRVSIGVYSLYNVDQTVSGNFVSSSAYGTASTTTGVVNSVGSDDFILDILSANSSTQPVDTLTEGWNVMIVTNRYSTSQYNSSPSTNNDMFYSNVTGAEWAWSGVRIKPIPAVPAMVPTLSGAGGWKELARASLTSNNSTFSVTIPEQKRYYMVLSNYETTGSANPYMRINADANQHYPQRYSMNGAGDGTPTTFTGFYGNVSGLYSGIPYFSVDHWANKSGQEKLVVRNLVMQNTAGASNAPNRAQMVGKYTQTGDMSSILIHGGTYYGNATNGSEIIVLGWDPDDTHTDNFWEELASVEYNASTPDELDTGTITAKKYLWVQAYVNTTGTQDNQAFRFNGNTGNNYCWRDSRDGATDVLSSPVAYNYLRTCVGDDNNNFVNAFISNKDGREKLIMSSAVKQSTAGTGVAPESNETVGKYTVQSGQITSIKLWQSGGGSFASGSIMKVWGHD